MAVERESVEFCLLGPLEVRRNGEPVQLGGAKQRALLARLLVDAPRVVSTDALVDGLWGERPPEKALHTVQVFVSRLRKAIGPEVLVTRAPGYLVDVADEGIDVSRFRTLVAEAERDLAGGRPQQASQCFERALALWRGPALADFAYEGWAGEHGERLEEERLNAVERLIDARLLLGHHSSVAGELEQLVSQHPLRERLRAQLMLTLYRSGRQADALTVYAQTREALLEQLGIDPSQELQTIYRRILNQDDELDLPSSASVSSLPTRDAVAATNLPAQPTRLIGRHRELAEAAAFITQDAVRLLTLTGPGGTGKTRLALQLAADSLDHFPHGVWFVNLAPLTDPELVLPTIAQTVGLKAQPGQPIASALADHLRDKGCLLVLDNLEQVAEAATALASLLASTPQLKLLATSRMPLHLSGEREYPVPPLAEEEALALFSERAQAAKPTFTLDGTRTLVAEICRRLDNLPLAIELAAARIKLLSERALLERLDEKLKLLAGGARDLPERQQTLRATIDWSYELLTAGEQRLFARLAVFSGGGTLEAIEAICNPVGDLDVFEGVASLLDKSLLRQEEDPDGESRFIMLETIHEYSRERLLESGEADDLARGHAEFFVEYFEARRELAREEGGRARFNAEQDNIRAALAWILESGEAELGMRFAAALPFYWVRCGSLEEGRRALENALAHAGAVAATLRMGALDALSTVAYFQGDYDRAVTAADTALRLARKIGDKARIAGCLHSLALAFLGKADYARAIPLYEESVALERELARPITLVAALTDFGYALLVNGDADRARRAFEEAWEIIEANDVGKLSILGFNLGLVCLEQDLTAEAHDHFHDALAESHRVGEKIGVVYGLIGLAAVARGAEAERAGRLLGAAERGAEEIGLALEPYEAKLRERTLARVFQHLGSEAAARAVSEGRALALEAAVEYALDAAVGDLGHSDEAEGAAPEAQPNSNDPN